MRWWLERKGTLMIPTTSIRCWWSSKHFWLTTSKWNSSMVWRRRFNWLGSKSRSSAMRIRGEKKMQPNWILLIGIILMSLSYREAWAQITSRRVQAWARKLNLTNTTAIRTQTTDQTSNPKEKMMILTTKVQMELWKETTKTRTFRILQCKLNMLKMIRCQCKILKASK